jgi:hypothetical protein
MRREVPRILHKVECRWCSSFITAPPNIIELKLDCVPNFVRPPIAIVRQDIRNVSDSVKTMYFETRSSVNKVLFGNSS